MSRKNYINRNRRLKSLLLEGKVVESILDSCMKEASIVELICIIQGGVLPIPYNTLKKYLFYLIEYDLISYSGQKQVFIITNYGWDLLYMIRIEKALIQSQCIDLMISLG